MAKEKNALVKENWSSSFILTGKPVIGNLTYKIDATSEKSDWVYNSLNLGVDCGEKHGVIYAELMGGYGAERENIIYAHGKKKNGEGRDVDDFSNRIEVAWEDRKNDSVLEEIGDMCFITVGLEKTVEGRVFNKKFLSAYDAIKYVQENLTSDMVVDVRGNIRYSMYNGKTQIHKDITKITLSDASGPANYGAKFTQTILINKDSASLKDIDKDKGVMYVHANVLDYVKEYNGVTVRGNFPHSVQFEFGMDFSDQERCKRVVNTIFNVKKGITQITFEGEFVESGAAVTATWDDVPQDIKELVDIKVYTVEEAIASCSTPGAKERRMILIRPVIKNGALQRVEEKFEEDDLILDCMSNNNAPFDEDDSSDSDDSMDWLDSIC